MTRRSWLATLLVVGAGAALLTFALRGGTPTTLNIARDAGLGDAVSLDISLPTSDGEEQWITITNRDTVAGLVTLLDQPLDIEQPGTCETVATLRFYTNTGAERIVEYACASSPILRGADDFWQAGAVTPPPGFIAGLEAQLAILP